MYEVFFDVHRSDGALNKHFIRRYGFKHYNLFVQNIISEMYKGVKPILCEIVAGGAGLIDLQIQLKL